MKFKVNHDKIKSKLSFLGGSFVSDKFQSDQYFNHPSRNFANSDEALRLRQSDYSCYLTYKGKKFDEQSKTRLEIDVKLTDKEQMTLINEIFTHLDFPKSGIVNKMRETWKCRGFTVVLDTIANLGEFVEIELLGEENNDFTKNYTRMIEKLREFAIELGLDPNSQIHKSYLEMILE